MTISKQRLAEIVSTKDSDIDYSDIPELDDNFWKNAKLVMPDSKVPVSLRLDQKVLDWFKKEGKGYQSRINAVLASYVRIQKSQ